MSKLNNKNWKKYDYFTNRPRITSKKIAFVNIVNFMMPKIQGSK